jgi:mannose-1-phosphate guanylyltransferase
VSKKKLRPIVLAGGSGKRLWPLSTKEKPKQFISLFGDLSLFDLSLQRLNNGSLFKRPIIVTSVDYLEFVEDSIIRTGIEPEKIILEPYSRNTFPAISLAVMISMLKDKEESFLVTPSDHYISKNKQFYTACKLAKSNVEKEGLTLFGVQPDRGSTEYGYIKAKNLDEEINEVEEFLEKPSSAVVKKILNKPNVLWNAGIFTFKGSWFLKACKEINKEIIQNIEDIKPKFYPSSLHFYPSKKKFKELSSCPFDKIFVEKNKKNHVISLSAGWSDLGSWVSLSELQKDPETQFTLFSENSFKREMRPWGFFEVLMETDSSKVKLISVSAGKKLSLQKHKYRSETWYVVQGKAKVTKGNERFTMLNGDSVIIDKNEEHRLENTSKEPLEIIEIQTGTYFGEDDIIRLKDSYGRADLH